MEGLLRIYSHPAMKHLAGAEKQCFPTDFFFHKFDPKRRWRWLWVRFCLLFFLKPNPFQCPPVPKHLIQWYSMIWLKSDSWSSKDFHGIFMDCIMDFMSMISSRLDVCILYPVSYSWYINLILFLLTYEHLWTSVNTYEHLWSILHLILWPWTWWKTCLRRRATWMSPDCCWTKALCPGARCETRWLWAKKHLNIGKLT